MRYRRAWPVSHAGAALLLAAAAGPAAPGQWSQAAEVLHDHQRCVAYQARLSGEYLVVRATHEPGWHTCAMDNHKRAQEKLAGRQPLGLDAPTEIRVSGGLEVAGPWRQTPPVDASRPELLWYTWRFEGQALFAVKVRRTGPGPARIAITGQACTETTCKKVDVTLSLPLDGPEAPGAPDLDLDSLVPVR